MQYLNGLRHPTIITILGAVVEPDVEPMMIMEYMQHGSLHSMLHNETMIMKDEILLPILRDISSGCRFLHAADPQIVHGDLKAANVLVDDKLRAKVADFGLASVRSTEGITGTPFWMAPELLRGESTTTATSDVFSMGVILYECFLRREPYEGEANDHLQILAQIADPLACKRPMTPKDCPASIASLMADCWLANPDERPSFEEIDMRLRRVEARADNKNTDNISLFDIFPSHVAEALRNGKKVEAEHKESVTIFFSDIIGFTTISSELDPRKVASMLDTLYRKFDELSDRHEVFKVETIGDAYVAVTNLVKNQEEDHVSRIAAFVVDAIRASNATMIDPDDPEKGHINIRCGFHTGPVVADVVGARNPRYCLFGDTVNTASRMESNSSQNRILCSMASADILREQSGKFIITHRGEIPVKGKGNMATYWIDMDGKSEPLPAPEAARAPPEAARSYQHREGAQTD
jgi:serine/threonine protein kinase